MKLKRIAVLGATGSVGKQALDVARARRYKIDFLSANTDVKSMENAVREFSPRAVAMADEASARELKTRVADTSCRVLFGTAGIVHGIAESGAETVVNAILGKAGLEPTLATIYSGRRLALANKESLVIAGDIVTSLARDRSVDIIPVDSEHSAIFQSLRSGKISEIKSIILTASGGPFYGKSADELESVTLADTLCHPTWKMGKKITVDSATLMNKGFEIIEASCLFRVPANKIKVVVHRESILHSAVEYVDNTVIGEFSVPDMRSCVQYAVDYPDRFLSRTEQLDLLSCSPLTFNKPDTEAFPLLPLAVKAMSDGGAMPAVLNASDEIAVDAFLNEKISFTQISEAILHTYDMLSSYNSIRDLDGIMQADREGRRVCKEYIERISK